MPAVSEQITMRGNTALRWLDELPGLDSPQMRLQLGAVIQELAAMRDGLIRLEREGKPDGLWLARTNGILSSIFGTEFPLEGLSRKRVEETRMALRQLLADMNAWPTKAACS